MKKIITLIAGLFLSGLIYAQIDTVYVRNLSLSYEEWKWIKGGWTPNDSLSKKQWRKLETAVTNAGSPTNSTQINVDSLHGSVVLLFYANFMGAAKGETRTMSNDIRSKIRAYTPILSFCDLIEANWDAVKDNKVKNGKDDFNKNQ